jgi:hypothetical protein
MEESKTGSNLLGTLSVGLSFCIIGTVLWGKIARADSGLTQVSTGSEEVPEEVLQIQVGVEANSPLTGQAQTVETYAREQRQLQVGASEVPAKLAPSVYRAVELLRLRQILKGLLPFL